MFFPFIHEKAKISEVLSAKQRQKDDENERKNWEAKREREERMTRERQQQEKEFFFGKVQGRVTRSRAKAGDGIGRKGYLSKAPQVNCHTFQRKLIRLGSIREYVCHASTQPTNFRRREIRLFVRDGRSQGKRANFQP